MNKCCKALIFYADPFSVIFYKTKGSKLLPWIYENGNACGSEPEGGLICGSFIFTTFRVRSTMFALTISVILSVHFLIFILLF